MIVVQILNRMIAEEEHLIDNDYPTSIEDYVKKCPMIHSRCYSCNASTKETKNIYLQKIE